MPEATDNVVLSPEEVLQLAKAELLQLVKSDIDEDVDPEKAFQLLQVRKCHLYYDGKQYLTFERNGEFFDFTTVGSPISSQGEEEEAYDYILNIVKGDGRKFVSVVGNRPPNVKGTADYPDDEESVQNALNANSVAKTLFSWWDIRTLHRYLVLQLWKSGTVFGYTPYVVNGYKYGKTSIPKWTTVPQELAPAGWECLTCGNRHEIGTPACPHCGQPLGPQDYKEAEVVNVPVQDGEKEYENGQVELQLYTVLHVTVPFYSQSFKDVPWLRLETEKHKAELFEIYPGLEDKLRDDHDTEGMTTSQAQSVNIRQSDSSPTGQGNKRKNLVTYSRYWLKPLMYNLIRDREKRDKIRRAFPDGMRIVRVKDEIVDLRHERMEDVWSYCSPEATDYIYGDPLSLDHVQIQDIVNDLINIGVETLERAVPWMMADPQVVDFKALKARVRRPAEVVPTIPGVGQNLRSAIQEAPVAEFSEQTLPFLTGVHEGVREIAGVQKAVFGGEPARETTAREYEGRRNQAMMQLTTTWDALRSFYGNVTTNAARQLARYGPQTLQDQTNPHKAIEVAALLKRNWHYEVEESIPITPGQRADRLMFLLGSQSPIVPTLFGLTHPENARAINDLLGMEGLYIPGADDIEAIKETIRRLLAEEPVMTTGPDGLPVVRPSIMPKWEEESQLAIAVIKAWALTKAGRYAADNNPLGYQNVIAYGEEHERRIAPPLGMIPGGPLPPNGGPSPDAPGGGKQPAPGSPASAAQPMSPVATPPVTNPPVKNVPTTGQV
jgi:hypothetical protein